MASVAAAGVGVDLTIQPGMKVYVMGAPTVWGVGGFTVHQGGALSLARIMLAQTASIAVSAGGSLALADLALREASQFVWDFVRRSFVCECMRSDQRL